MKSGYSMNCDFLTKGKGILSSAQQEAKCVLCGNTGKSLYFGLCDQLFGAPGVWDFNKCTNTDCRLIWLEPMPLKDEIAKAYENYYTHGVKFSNLKTTGIVSTLYRLIKRTYIGAKYGYPQPFPRFRFLGKLMHFFPIRRAEAEEEIRFLPCVPGGLLLDIGCGDGQWMLNMRDMGWQVEGVDFDAEAIRAARANGLNVRCGTLTEQNYADGTFDAITLNHVVEHLTDAVAVLRECKRVLKRGGRLLLFSPNAESLGHRLFRSCWRGLEPPRHLYLYCSSSVDLLLQAAGFTSFSVRTISSKYIIQQSLALCAMHLSKGGNFALNYSIGIVSQGLCLIEDVFITKGVHAGECLVVEGIKS